MGAKSRSRWVCTVFRRQMFSQPAEPSADQIALYFEIGKKRVFAGAVEWPGWCRSGRDSGAALRALLEYGPRYAEVLREAGLGFQAPTDIRAFAVVERLPGTTTTDFGAPDVASA